MMETHIYSEFPTHLSVVHIALFTQVTNSSLIRERILGAAVSELASDREAVNFAFVNANLVRFPFVSHISLTHFDCSDH
jgi:EKC/KEOPS complex subunit CGI121/TPRKB